MAGHVSVNIHLSKGSQIGISRPLAAHPHLNIDGATIFFGFDDDQVERGISSMIDALMQLKTQVQAERLRRESLAENHRRQFPQNDWRPSL